MTAGLQVIAPGLYSTVQDMGRWGFQNSGVPVSGPLDRIALALANALVGNGENTAALEMLMQGPTLEVGAESVRLACVGAEDLIVAGADGCERSLPAGRSATLVRNERVRVGKLVKSSCAYLAVEGGIDVPHVLGSAATLTRNGMGGLHGRALKAGDRLPLCLAAAPERYECEMKKLRDLKLNDSIRVVLGPQDDFFTDAALDTLLSAAYTISQRADRMGFRLDGPKLEHGRGHDIVSDGIVAGSIQVPGSGLPIVLLADAQTTGGYPKIATVISADVPLVGRRRPGSTIAFVAVSAEEAEAARRAQQNALETAIRQFRPVVDAAHIDVDALHDNNLVDGVANALE